ncbi:DUF748 domain-containing protein [Flammeovirgaceae bacterium SG7u.111]|nr:DUF748 domain-containing protein [Flammeovirgaceae bacterium SG7u.132]WPO34520.1 DUF748 domain-containing protein [Flammeovirgaceae bacterium SG7u.111]
MRKKIAITIGILVFLIASTLFFLSEIARQVTVKNGKEWIGRRVAIDNISLNYWDGSVEVAGFTLFEADDSTNFISFDTLFIDTEPLRFISNEIVVEKLLLKGLNTNIIMYDSTFNFDDLLAFHQKEKAMPKDSTQSEPLKFKLSNLELSEALITARDEAIGKQFEMRNLAFFIPFIGWDQTQASEAGLKFDLKNGGFVQSTLNFNPNKGDFSANIILEKLDLTGYSDFVKKYLAFGDFTGLASLSLNLNGNIKAPEKTLINGKVGFEDFKLKDFNNYEFTKLAKLDVKLKEIDLDKMRFIVDSVTLTQPYLYFEMFDSTNNLQEFVQQMAGKANKTAADRSSNKPAKKNELYYAVNNLYIKEGIIDIIDKRTTDPFNYHLSQISLASDTITSTSNWVEANANMLLNERGKLVAMVGADPTNPMELLLDYTITDFMLSDLNIYSKYYMGFPILYGDMYYKARTEIRSGVLTSENKLVIHNVELGSKSKGLYDLPMKFALFLLKDKDGVITLDVPVRGDLNDPKVRVGKIVWNTFKNLIVKTAAAPVKLLSGFLGTDPKNIKSIEYSYLDTAFTNQKQKQLDLLLDLEQKKPELEIELVYFNDIEKEKEQIAVWEMEKRFAEKKKKDPKKDKEDFEKFVRKQAKSDTLEIMDASLLLIAPEILDSVALDLQTLRSQQLETYLKAQNDSTEIAVHLSKPNAPKNLGSGPIFEVKYGMKEELLESGKREE